jgi:hypothetical protein
MQLNPSVHRKMKALQKSSLRDPGFFLQKMKTYFDIMIALRNMRKFVLITSLKKPKK